LIYSLPQKLRAIAALGADAMLLIHFDEPFSRQTGEEFVRGLTRDLGHILSVCVGAEFVFGYQRGGNVALLKRLGNELRFGVHGLASVSLDGQAVSSTRIRTTIASGDLDAASQMLGRPYSLAGRVIHGDHLGRQLGAPTANIDTEGLILPPNGVYAVHALAAGQTYRAALNIGTRPTLANPAPQLRVEAHLLDFQGDLYGQELELTFVEKLRDERHFASLADLRRQIAKDMVSVARIFDASRKARRVRP
jgi:riboflavin kinase/FMN adenylyltransferase